MKYKCLHVFKAENEKKNANNINEQDKMPMDAIFHFFLS